jgi:hypothetical protein
VNATPVKVVAQRRDWDCGVAALAMLLARDYGDVSAAVRQTLDPARVKRRGLGVRDAIRVGATLGARLKAVRRRRDYLVGTTGMLGLLGEECAPHGHWVVFKNGTIIDPNHGEVWDAPGYLAHYQLRPCTLLVVQKKS